MTLPSPTWQIAVHEAHVRLGVKLAGNCTLCAADPRPEWVRLRDAHGLPAKDYTAAAR